MQGDGDILDQKAEDDRAAVRSMAGVAGPAAPLNCTVIRIRETGGHSPLFLIDGEFNDVGYSLLLSRCIDQRIPVYGLNAGTREGGAVARTVEGMAAYLLGGIRRVQPKGPYLLLGWSFGGMLAYEIANQLLGADEEVAFLGLLNAAHLATAPDAREKASAQIQTDDTSLLQQLARVKKFETSNADPRDLVAQLPLCQTRSPLPESIRGDEVAKYLAGYRSRLQASLEYRAQPIPIPVYLLAPAKRFDREERLGWEAVLPSEQIKLVIVPGSDSSIADFAYIAALGSAVSKSLELAAENASGAPHASYSSSVVIQSGRHERVPIFCIPGAGGSVAGFADLASALGPSRPVHGFQPRGLDGMAVPHSTVEAAASAYLRAISETYPGGPLHLLGHSFGGWVAFEMAQRLRAAGRDPVSVVLIDSHAPCRDASPLCEYTSQEAFMKLISLLDQLAERSLEIDLGDIADLTNSGRLELLHQRLVRSGLMPPRSKARALRGMLRTFEAALRCNYRPRALYPGRVHLVLAADPVLDGPANDRRAKAVEGWRCQVADLVSWQASGNHMTMLKPPHCRSLASWLDKYVFVGA